MMLLMEWAQIIFLILASMTLFAWMVTGRNQNWLFTLGNGFAIAAVAIFVLKSIVPL